MTPTEVRLRAELRDSRALVAAQNERLEALQAANEGAYREAYDAQGGPHHCSAQPFGEPADRDANARLTAEVSQLRTEVNILDRGIAATEEASR